MKPTDSENFIESTRLMPLEDGMVFLRLTCERCGRDVTDKSVVEGGYARLTTPCICGAGVRPSRLAGVSLIIASVAAIGGVVALCVWLFER